MVFKSLEIMILDFIQSTIFVAHIAVVDDDLFIEKLLLSAAKYFA